MGERNKITFYVFQIKLAVKAGNFNRFEIESGGRNKLCLHLILCSDEENFSVRKSFSYLPCGGKGGIDVAARSSGGKIEKQR